MTLLFRPVSYLYVYWLPAQICPPTRPTTPTFKLKDWRKLMEIGILLTHSNTMNLFSWKFWGWVWLGRVGVFGHVTSKYLNICHIYIYLTSPQLMEIPSLALSPVAPVRFSLSEPARSTKWNFAVRVSNSFTTSVVSVSFPSSCGIWKQERLNLDLTLSHKVELSCQSQTHSQTL